MIVYPSASGNFEHSNSASSPATTLTTDTDMSVVSEFQPRVGGAFIWSITPMYLTFDLSFMASNVEILSATLTGVTTEPVGLFTAKIVEGDISNYTEAVSQHNAAPYSIDLTTNSDLILLLQYAANNGWTQFTIFYTAKSSYPKHSVEAVFDSPTLDLYFLTGPKTTFTSLGPELINNGTFTGSATGWTLDNMLYSSNQIERDFGGIPCSAIHDTVSFSSSNTYRVSANVIARGGTTWIQFNGTNTQEITTTGIQTWDLVPASTGVLKFNATTGTANLTLDDISCKLIGSPPEDVNDAWEINIEGEDFFTVDGIEQTITESQGYIDETWVGWTGNMIETIYPTDLFAGVWVMYETFNAWDEFTSTTMSALIDEYLTPSVSDIVLVSTLNESQVVAAATPVEGFYSYAPHTRKETSVGSDAWTQIAVALGLITETMTPADLWTSSLVTYQTITEIATPTDQWTGAKAGPTIPTAFNPDIYCGNDPFVPFVLGSVTLGIPVINDREIVNLGRVSNTSLSGKLRARNQGVNFERRSFQFEDLTPAKKDEYLAFIDANLGLEVSVTTHEEEELIAIVDDVQQPTVVQYDDGCGWVIGFSIYVVSVV